MKRLLATLIAFVCCAGPTMLRADEPQALAASLQPYVDRHELAGAVALVAGKDGVLSVECVGYANIGENKPMTEDALFWIASQTKPITAAAVMMLVDEGKLKLDDPIEQYLPEFRGQMVIAEQDDQHVLLRKPARPHTVRDALSHMIGMPFRSAIEEPTLDGLPLAAAVRSYAMTPLASDPGVRYQYSNAGINTAARLIEVVTGQSYEDFMQQRLFDPLGMSDTTFWPDESQSQRVARSYRPDAAKTNLEEFPIAQLIYPLSDRVHRFPMPAGGLFSTAHDVAQFCRMLLNGGELNGTRYLSPEAVAELSHRQTPQSVQESYGLGFSVGGDWFGHGGAHATNMEIRPQQGLVLVWLVQHAGFPGNGGQAQGEFRTWALEKFKQP